MISFEKIKAFYEQHLPEAAYKGHYLVAPCPFCQRQAAQSQGRLTVLLNPDSYFRGYFRCQNRCIPGGFHFHFGRLMGVEANRIPGHDPDEEGYVVEANYPPRNLQGEIDHFCSLLGQEQTEFFGTFGVTRPTLNEMHIGFNGRYMTYPYYQENGQPYAAHCIIAGRDDDHFWHGNETFTEGEFRVYNAPEIQRCQAGALFVTEGEINLLILKELGYPAVAVPDAADLVHLAPERLALVNHIFLLLGNTPEARQVARALAVELGFKARILNWPASLERGAHMTELACDEDYDTQKTLAAMIRTSKSFSPFASPQKERRHLLALLEREKGKEVLGIATGFAKLDQALEGLRGINILGGPPKAGKSCFFMQVSTEAARLRRPVIYYDFENGRQKIYLRTLTRLSSLPEKKIRQGDLNEKEAGRLQQALAQWEEMLGCFRVVTDRMLTPEIMRRHIDFIKHETQKEELLIVIDSLHKLPFKDLSERRTGIDSWLRQLEAIRDEQGACFLVISELSRGKGGGYGERPDLSSFKESGDIEYSADNAMILMPGWDPLEPVTTQQRKSILWVVASRENNPGKVAEYILDYPFWRFKEQ